VVFVIHDNVAQQRNVTTGATDYQCCTEIVAGVSDGETVVTAGQANLVDGTKVKIRETLN